MKLKPSSFLLLGALLFLLSAAPAFADSFTLTFSFTGQVATGSGVFTVDSTAMPGQYLVTAVTGTVNGSPVSQLIDPGGYPAASPPANDNLLFYPETADTTFVDENGVSFEDSTGTDYNLYYGTFQSSDYGYQVITGVSGLDGGTLDSLTLGAPVPVPTPEPGSLLLVGSGLMGIFGLTRRCVSRNTSVRQIAQ